VTRRTIFLDSDGTGGEWMHVVIAHPTGIEYQQQYGGTACRQGTVEGYLVPVWAPDELAILRRVFEGHLKGAGSWSQRFTWPPKELTTVIEAVERITFWPSDHGAPERLRFDHDRLADLDEAWVPVVTSDGSGVLVWANSD
jgi:hypothetical protein